MNYQDYEKLNVVKNEIPYSKVVDFINFIVTNSFSAKDGKYHEYLLDYSEAVAILTMYTDCSEYDFKFDDVMRFVQSDKWGKIKEELGDAYIFLHYYVKKEIDYLITPMRLADDAFKKIAEAANGFNEIIKAIDIDALKQYDFDKIINAVNLIDVGNTVEGKEDQSNDNIVDFKK